MQGLIDENFYYYFGVKDCAVLVCRVASYNDCSWTLYMNT